MTKNKQKLELTWIGKDEEIKLEPRILIEDPSKSYGDPDNQNMLIHGDNLLALKALEQDFAGKIKCIYIDPPYNTGNAFEHYDDNLEHSTWLNLMKPRMELLKSLLSEDGSIWISIDDDELHYLKVLCDEVFDRSNFVTTIAVKMSTASGVKTSHRERTIIKEKEFILCYAKNKKLVKFIPQYVPDYTWDTEFQYFLEKEKSDDSSKWKVYRLSDILKKEGIPNNPQDIRFIKFVEENSFKIWRRAFIRGKLKEESIKNPDIIYVKKDANKEHYVYRGREMFFLSDKKHICFTENGYVNARSRLLGDFWSDINTGKLFNEGNIDFRNGKKPEFLIARILELSTNKNDIVMDSFLGSGTTSAVAHKMQRQWIGIELGDHAYTHCIPRIKSLVDNLDSAGMTNATNWKGGGGYRFYELAPSLLNKDKHKNWVISKEYNADMLASAMAKHEGFTYQPDNNFYWKQGRSTENDYIFTTTNNISSESLDAIHDEMRPEESLLICCRAFQPSCDSKYENITIKKIPQMLLGRCEFGKDDYSLNIVNIPQMAEYNDNLEIENPVFETTQNEDAPNSEQLGLLKENS
jgi:adenine-specific DNA-methyltransferase